ncbi:hypothetical protein U1Q18_026489 [Sarracenia purpurea var. burkii]
MPKPQPSSVGSVHIGDASLITSTVIQRRRRRFRRSEVVLLRWRGIDPVRWPAEVLNRKIIGFP